MWKEIVINILSILSVLIMIIMVTNRYAKLIPTSFVTVGQLNSKCHRIRSPATEMSHTPQTASPGHLISDLETDRILITI